MVGVPRKMSTRRKTLTCSYGPVMGRKGYSPKAETLKGFINQYELGFAEETKMKMFMNIK